MQARCLDLKGTLDVLLSLGVDKVGILPCLHRAAGTTPRQENHRTGRCSEKPFSL